MIDSAVRTYIIDGLKVIVSPDRPRYVLPAEVMPGVPWPPGFRDDINGWSARFLGMTNLVPRGQCLVLHGETVLVGPETFAALKGATT